MGRPGRRAARGAEGGRDAPDGKPPGAPREEETPRTASRPGRRGEERSGAAQRPVADTVAVPSTRPPENAVVENAWLSASAAPWVSVVTTPGTVTSRPETVGWAPERSRSRIAAFGP